MARRDIQAAIKEFSGLSAEQTKRKILAQQNGDEETEEPENHGNTGLPFGLCKKHGIALPDNATPRDAWEALKGIGIYPPWTDKGKGQYSGANSSDNSSGNNSGDNLGEKLSPDKKKIYDSINEKLSSFPQEYREKLSQALLNLTDDEIAVVSRTINNAQYSKGKGSFNRWGKILTIPTGEGGALDKELGYDFEATTFFHEYWHYLANEIAIREDMSYRDFNESPELQAIFNADAQGLLERVAAEMGVEGKPLVSRIKQEYKLAFRDYLDKLTDKKIAHAIEPVKPQKREIDREQYINNQMKWYGFTREKAEAYVDDIIKRAEESYQEDLNKYNERLVWWNTVKDQKAQAQAKHKRYGFISDFIAGATSGRINPYNYEHWGHADSYWTGSRGSYVSTSGQANGVETWAEYVSFKMSKDTKGLEAFKDYLPRTFQKYEEMYSKLTEVIK